VSSTTQIPKLLMRLWAHLSRRRRIQFVLLTGLMIVSAFAEVVSLGAVLPFLGVLTDPERVFNFPFIASNSHHWGFSTPNQLIFPLTVAFSIAVIFAGAIRILLLWAITRVVVACGSELSMEVYRRTLYQPYSVHVARNSSEVISGIIIKVNSVVFGVMLTSLTLISSVVLLLAVITALVAIDPIVATAAACGFGTSYALITLMTRRRLQLNSTRIAQEQTQVVKALHEGLGGIRDVLLDGTQSVYCDIYRSADLPLRQAQGNNSFISQSPRYIMEALGILVIAALAYGLSQQAEGFASALPVIGALALGAQRLLPALQHLYSNWTTIVGSHSSLVDVIELLNQPLPFKQLSSSIAPLHMLKNIRYDAVRFRYSKGGPWVLDGINLVIPKGARIGFVGSTGSGKSTALDLLMGLLLPSEGEILVDEQPIIGERLNAWQRSIAHVPQSIYLADTTFAENIAFGLPPDTIDMNRVQQAARQAQIADFIESKSGGYSAFVGERGIRLSGGQRQRIGIARALYKQASVLVFDEATSALDQATERAVMEAIEGLSRELTILLIAHRITTLHKCDIIFKIENGRLVPE
jgi:ABC-type multidrug transport system fused ATPase/permease subunit